MDAPRSTGPPCQTPKFRRKLASRHNSKRARRSRSVSFISLTTSFSFVVTRRCCDSSTRKLLNATRHGKLSRRLCELQFAELYQQILRLLRRRHWSHLTNKALSRQLWRKERRFGRLRDAKVSHSRSTNAASCARIGPAMSCAWHTDRVTNINEIDWPTFEDGENSETNVNNVRAGAVSESNDDSRSAE